MTAYYTHFEHFVQEVAYFAQEDIAHCTYSASAVWMMAYSVHPVDRVGVIVDQTYYLWASLLYLSLYGLLRGRVIGFAYNIEISP